MYANHFLHDVLSYPSCKSIKRQTFRNRHTQRELLEQIALHKAVFTWGKWNLL